MSVIDSVLNQSVNTPWTVHSADSINRFFLPPGTEVNGRFLSDTVQKVSPALIYDHHYLGFPNWYYYLFFGLIAVFAVFRFYYPRVFGQILSYLRSPLLSAEKENSERPGFMIVFFQFIAYLIDLGLLIYLMNQNWHWVQVHEQTFFTGLVFWSLVVLLYFGLNQILTVIIGFLFETSQASKIHIKINAYSAYSLAIFLTPVLFLFLYTGVAFLLYLAVLIVVVSLLFKWIQIFRIGLFHTGYTAFHLFLYLCALEIIPVLLLFRVAVLQV
ncbi:MAG: DUF4271 domain-containing protein [Bacteroidales bacterium]|nr:DUF4271 domain-containing protein [Bacteroidales bacterium]